MWCVVYHQLLEGYDGRVVVCVELVDGSVLLTAQRIEVHDEPEWWRLVHDLHDGHEPLEVVDEQRSDLSYIQLGLRYFEIRLHSGVDITKMFANNFQLNLFNNQ